MIRNKPPKNTPTPRGYTGGNHDFDVVRQQDGHIAGHPFDMDDDCPDDDKGNPEGY